MHPPMLYGTAWKEDRTAHLVEQALAAGFRGFDTANQRKHYHEAGVGAALAPWLASHPRESLFLQTKFTFMRGQDHRLPYDRDAPVATQVAQSFRSSLEHLGATYLDSYVLHGPSQRPGLGRDDWAVWRAMEALFDAGGTRHLGVSNIELDQLRLLTDGARIRPSFVQNRCYATQGWDGAVRRYCRENGITYQGFSLLTANRQIHPVARQIGVGRNWTAEQVIFRLALDVGMLPLTGSTSAEHLRQDLAVVTGDPLTPEEHARLGA